MSTITEPARIEVDEIKTREPLWSVKSRVSWGALSAGAVVAVVSYCLLELLGAAVAISLSDSITAQQLGMTAGIWTFVALILAMFLGGWISALYTTGEFRYEAFLYGVVVWGVASLVLIPLSTLGIGASVGTVLASRGMAKIQSETEPLLVSAQEQFAKKTGRVEELVAVLSRRMSKAASEGTSADRSSSSDENHTSSQSTSARQEETSTSDTNDNNTSASSSSEDSRQASQDDNSNDERSKEAKSKLVTASWYAFGGTLLSVLAAVFGAAVGPTTTVTHHKIAARNAPVVARTSV